LDGCDNIFQSKQFENKRDHLINKVPKSKFPSINEVAKCLLKKEYISENNKKLGLNLRELMEIWIILSKYEHIGYHSHFFTSDFQLDNVLAYVTPVLISICSILIQLINKFDPNPLVLRDLINLRLELIKDLDLLKRDKISQPE